MSTVTGSSEQNPLEILLTETLDEQSFVNKARDILNGKTPKDLVQLDIGKIIFNRLKYIHETLFYIGRSVANNDIENNLLLFNALLPALPSDILEEDCYIHMFPTLSWESCSEMISQIIENNISLVVDLNVSLFKAGQSHMKHPYIALLNVLYYSEQSNIAHAFSKVNMAYFIRNFLFPHCEFPNRFGINVVSVLATKGFKNIFCLGVISDIRRMRNSYPEAAKLYDNYRLEDVLNSTPGWTSFDYLCRENVWNGDLDEVMNNLRNCLNHWTSDGYSIYDFAIFVREIKKFICKVLSIRKEKLLRHFLFTLLEVSQRSSSIEVNTDTFLNLIEMVKSGIEECYLLTFLSCETCNSERKEYFKSAIDDSLILLKHLKTLNCCWYRCLYFPYCGYLVDGDEFVSDYLTNRYITFYNRNMVNPVIESMVHNFPSIFSHAIHRNLISFKGSSSTEVCNKTFSEPGDGGTNVSKSRISVSLKVFSSKRRCRRNLSELQHIKKNVWISYSKPTVGGIKEIRDNSFVLCTKLPGGLFPNIFGFCNLEELCFLGELLASHLNEGKRTQDLCDELFNCLFISEDDHFGQKYHNLSIIMPEASLLINRLLKVKRKKLDINSDPWRNAEEKHCEISNIKFNGRHSFQEANITFKMPMTGEMMVENDSIISLTPHNVDDYLEGLSIIYSKAENGNNMAAIRKGFEEIYHFEWLKAFSASDLRFVLSKQHEFIWNTESVSRFIVPSIGYDANSAQISYLSEALVNFKKINKQKFLYFITGSSRLERGDISNFHTYVKVSKMNCPVGQEDETLPRASSHWNVLYLPEYTLGEVLSERLLAAIEKL